MGRHMASLQSLHYSKGAYPDCHRNGISQSNRGKAVSDNAAARNPPLLGPGAASQPRRAGSASGSTALPPLLPGLPLLPAH